MSTSIPQSIIDLTDQLGELDKQLSGYDSLVARRETIRKQLSEFADSIGDTDINLHGNHYVVTFSKAPVMREIKPERYPDFMRLVGPEAFMQTVKVSVSAASKLLGKADQERLFSTSKGPRRLKSVVAVERVTQTTEQEAIVGFYESLAWALNPTGGQMRTDPSLRPGPF